MNSEAELYEAIAEYIEKHGWCQGSAYFDEKACIMGAYWKVCKGIGVDSHRRDMPTLIDLIGTHLVGSWNDEPTRTKQEVLDKLHEAAKVASVGKED